MQIRAGRWCLFLLVVLAILSSRAYARYTISISGGFTKEEVAVVLEEIEGRSLKVWTQDYAQATANRGHDPKSKSSGGGRKGL